MLHTGVAEVLMAGEQGLPDAYDIKVKDGQVLHKALPFVYRRIGPLVGSRADVDPVGGFATPHYQLVLLVGHGIPYIYFIGPEGDEVERAREWAHRFNELAHAGRQDEPQT
jgi:hypothetical protein